MRRNDPNVSRIGSGLGQVRNTRAVNPVVNGNPYFELFAFTSIIFAYTRGSPSSLVHPLDLEPVRITLIHDPTPDYEKLSNHELISRFQQHGYEAGYYSSKTKDLAQALNKPEALVVVAGGNGTIGKIAQHLAEKTRV
jgi:diacylglycerol kinase (ATP)